MRSGSQAGNGRINIEVGLLLRGEQRRAGESICDVVSLPRDPVDIEGISGDLLPYALQAGTCQSKQVFLENSLQRPMVGVNSEAGKAV